MMKLTLSHKRILAVTVALSSATALAQAQVEKTERCATRLSIAFLGKSADAAMMSLADPQSKVDELLRSPDFIERFARFVNGTFNDEPGMTPEADSAYYLARYILQNNRPWEEMFLGQYKVDRVPNTNPVQVAVTADANGLGYFRSRPWMERYAGNEPAGIRIATAYRMMNNTIGLKLVASTNAPGADVSATGRQAAGCRACHYDGWFALDKTAAVLGTVTRTNNTITFNASTAGPQQLLGGITVSNDKELVTALVKSEAFRFRTCRMAFEFLYGRPEATCEGPVFDQCMAEFSAKGTIQSALAAVAKSPTYCQ